MHTTKMPPILKIDLTIDVSFCVSDTIAVMLNLTSLSFFGLLELCILKKDIRSIKRFFSLTIFLHFCTTVVHLEWAI